MVRRTVRGWALGAGAIGAMALFAGCGGLTDRGDNVANGKQLFVAECGSCHILNRAGTKGTTGPNLDQAFARARQDGFGDSTFEGIVHRQIGQPARRPQVDPETGKTASMPANLVTGDDARDVAAYVAMAAATRGKDTGQLASVGAKAKGTTREKNGVLAIPVNEQGGLAFEFAAAQASAGQVTLESRNPEPIGHNIAVEGNGIDEKGPVVQGGAVSKVSVDLRPGSYTFYCSVPGHREGGMVGKLTVK
jgi:uncharacterized cupredoxin-like copper-binding protein